MFTLPDVNTQIHDVRDVITRSDILFYVNTNGVEREFVYTGLEGIATYSRHH